MHVQESQKTIRTILTDLNRSREVASETHVLETNALAASVAGWLRLDCIDVILYTHLVPSVKPCGEGERQQARRNGRDTGINSGQLPSLLALFYDDAGSRCYQR